MYIRVRDFTKPPGQQDTIITTSKNAKIEDLREEILQLMDVDFSKQELFYKGKQLMEGHCVIDYSILLNDVVQLVPRKNLPKPEVVEGTDGVPSVSTEPVAAKEVGESKYYKVNDLVDYLEPELGAWFEGVIVNIFKTNGPLIPNDAGDDNKEPELEFRVQSVTDQGYVDLNFDDIRPRAYYYYKHEELALDTTVMANYNLEKPNHRGYWYEFIITKKTAKYLQGTLVVGKSRGIYLDRTVKLVNEILRIEMPILLDERSSNIPLDIPLRTTAYICEQCNDIQTKKCFNCGCKICAGKNDKATIILCDDCDGGYHIKCLNPPLSEVPSDPEWYCPNCKVDVNEIVQAGEKLKASKKKRASSSKKESTRDWGRGMATVGRQSECTIVPRNHFGPIPGIQVGTVWAFRVQVSESGVHRAPVGGIHGRDREGAYSLVLSGGYEDDVDNGEEFIYTGSGGRDLSGNKRVNEQSKDQELTRMNRALAKNCNTPISEDGGKAKNWKEGLPVRVIRSYKLKKHSKYAPEVGNRYDGIYKVIKYYREKGKSGFYVWKFVLRRDDQFPAPWQKGGQELDVIYPEGYVAAMQAQKENLKSSANKKTSGRKRTAPTSTCTSASEDSASASQSKKAKIQPFILDDATTEMISMDTDNTKLWEECKEVCKEGQKKFLEKIEELFMCICCFELVYLPVSLQCKHNVCQRCLKRSFESKIYTCPVCRFDLGYDTFKITVNKALQSLLTKLFPGYEAKR